MERRTRGSANGATLLADPFMLPVNMRSRCLMLFFVAGLISSCAPSTSVQPPPGWKTIDAQTFEFSVPPDFRAVPVQGIDSFVGQYNGSTISLAFDYGWYSDPLDYKGKPEYVRRSERIGGNKAKVVSYYNPGSGHPFEYVIGVHFSEAGGNNSKLTLYATCKTTNDYETARMIFRTVKFKAPKVRS